MVGEADVDANFESEVREEMQKYGQITSVTVHKVRLYCIALIPQAYCVQMPGLPDNESVRVFLEFTNIAQATKVGNNIMFCMRTLYFPFRLSLICRGGSSAEEPLEQSSTPSTTSILGNYINELDLCEINYERTVQLFST